MWTVGISVLFGGGRRGVGPVPALTGKVAVSPQPASAMRCPGKRGEQGLHRRHRVAIAPTLRARAQARA
jgi:hypothetical protein